MRGCSKWSQEFTTFPLIKMIIWTFSRTAVQNGLIILFNQYLEIQILNHFLKLQLVIILLLFNNFRG